MTIPACLTRMARLRRRRSATSFRYATANDEARGNLILNVGSKKWASLTSVTYGSFGDLVQGGIREDKYPDFGKKNFIAERINNTDTAVTNSNTYKQCSSVYYQFDFTQKLLFHPSSNITHLFNL